MLKKIARFFSNPIRLAILNAVLILGTIALNFYYQVFCIPSNWAMIVLAICFVNTITVPLTIAIKRLHLLIGFLNGVSFFLFIYCIIFLSHMNLLGLLMILIGVGLLTFVPHFFAIQLFLKSVIKPVSKTVKHAFIIGVTACFAGTFYVGYQYSQAITEIQSAQNSNYENLEKSFFNEKIIGMHFIYHTRFCEFDGWRPPIHEPILVLGMWMNGGTDPLNISLEERIQLYKTLYPENKIKFDCSCAQMYSSTYHNEPLLK